MFLVNGMKAKLRQFNRDENNNIFDDQGDKEIIIKCCPYDVDNSINFGIYTHDEAIGYYQVPRTVDVRVGDQIIFLGGKIKAPNFKEEVHTILKVYESYIYNRIEYYIIMVK